ncbi:MAG: PEGA domain-containing protein [Deltaproteobacteria bacterium]|nr:MAG: PEGA domain-containing protein [Deltaproteobacteria bacterium]
MNVLGWLWWLGLGLWSSAPATSLNQCVAHYKNQKFNRAGQCFQRHAQKLPSTTALQRITKGRVLQNAAQSYQQAAQVLLQSQQDKQSKTPVYLRPGWLRVVKLRRQAYDCLKQVLQEQLYEDALAKDQLNKTQAQLQPLLGNVTLTLRSRMEGTRFCIRRLPAGKLRCFEGQRWQVQVVAGRYEATAEVPGLQQREKDTLLLPPNAPKMVLFSFKLAEAQATLEVAGQPKGVRIYLNGEYKGKAPLRLKITEGRHRISWTKRCYRTVTQTHNLRRNQTYTLNASLKRGSAYLRWQQSKKANPRRRVLGWSMVGLSVALVGTLVASYSIAESSYKQARDEYLVQGRSDSFLASGQRSNTFRTIGHISTGLAAGSMGVGLWQLLTITPTSSKYLLCGFTPPPPPSKSRPAPSRSSGHLLFWSVPP